MTMREARTTPLPTAQETPAPAQPAGPANHVTLRDGKKVVLKELSAADEAAIEALLCQDEITVSGVGRATYLRGLSLAAIASIDGQEVAKLRHREQYERYLNMFSGRDAARILNAYLAYMASTEEGSGPFR